MATHTTEAYSHVGAIIRRTLFVLTLMTVSLSPTYASSNSKSLDLYIQPVMDSIKTEQAYQPLAQYLAQLTGQEVNIRTSPNFLSYWSSVTKKKTNALYLDAAHFTAYRARKMGFEVIAKMPDSVSYSIIVRDSEMVFDASELVGRRIASLGAPSIGAARLGNMFPNPSRQPVLVEVFDSQSGIDMLLNNKVYAAIIPTPLVSALMNNDGQVNVVTTTMLVPHIALSASPDISKDIVSKIRGALLGAVKTDKGKAMLKGIGFAKFEMASKATYAQQDKILNNYWGY
ncbi:MAG: PhnD/SsuA/transferrin family substrate-binding protein [Proteobacteria bacterium]|nr:PhnD/SsuA/transferrin family substrate-binding protein [Pseudomonadota bacterium]